MHNKFRRQRQRFVLFALMIGGLFFPVSARAADVVQINPPKTRLIISPGSTQTGTINVLNNAKEAKKVKVYLEDWVYLPACDGSKDFRPAGTTELSAANWISFVPAEFSIPAYGRQVINYAVKVPPEAGGGHYAVLFFENYLGEQKTPAEGVSVNLAVRVASLFYIEPKGTIKREARIDELKIAKKEDKFYITVSFTNIGNVDITTKANFFIIDEKGMAYARGEFNDVYTFPGNTAVLTSSWKERIPRGKYDLILTVDMGKALREAGLGEVPAITKEAQIEIGGDGEVMRIGELR